MRVCSGVEVRLEEAQVVGVLMCPREGEGEGEREAASGGEAVPCALEDVVTLKEMEALAVKEGAPVLVAPPAWGLPDTVGVAEAQREGGGVLEREALGEWV